MTTKATTRKRASTQRKADPTGRVDVLAVRVLEGALKRYNNPLVDTLYQQFAPALKMELTRRLGPRNKRMRQVRDLVKSVAQQQRPTPAPLTKGGRA